MALAGMKVDTFARAHPRPTFLVGESSGYITNVMALAEPRNELGEVIRQYTALSNRENWLVLRRHSRANVRAWLQDLTQLSDQVVRTGFWDTAIGRFHIYIPDHEDISRALKHLTAQSLISPQALESYASTAHYRFSGVATLGTSRRMTGFSGLVNLPGW